MGKYHNEMAGKHTFKSRSNPIYNISLFKLHPPSRIWPVKGPSPVCAEGLGSSGGTAARVGDSRVLAGSRVANALDPALGGYVADFADPELVAHPARTPRGDASEVGSRAGGRLGPMTEH